MGGWGREERREIKLCNQEITTSNFLLIEKKKKVSRIIKKLNKK
jgi:hypothetical protein